MMFDLFSILAFGGGLALFLYGMHLMSSSLERMTGGKMERLLKKMTANPPVSILLGAAITAIVQSSSATTVMLVGLVNSGILRFSQAIYVCYGANIGTTVTAWIFSLMGVESDNLAVQFFQPVNLAPVIALIGAFLLLFSKKEQRRTVGAAFVGFAILIVGMTQMSSAVEPLSEMPRFLDLLSGLKNPAVGFLFSATFTAVIQSSSAATGILQTLTVTGGIRLGMAIPMVMGINVGTCVTAVLSSIGASTGARRVAVSHLTMNLLCSVICLPLLMIGNALMDWSIMEQAVSPASIALLHTLFNIVLTLLLLPFTKQQLALVEWIVKEKPSAKQSAAERNLSPDERLLASPSVAVAECEQLTVQMSRLAHNTLRDTVGLLEHYDPSTADRILRHENQLDRMEDQLGTYLVKLSTKALSDADSRAISRMLHSIGEFERLGDHAVNLVEVCKELDAKKLTFSEHAQSELNVLTHAILEILALTERAFDENSTETAKLVEPLEEVIDRLICEIREHHVARLRDGSCTIELGFILSDLLTNYERVSDHCSNVAVAVIELKHDSFDTHRYLNAVKSGDADFLHSYDAFAQKYKLE